MSTIFIDGAAGTTGLQIHERLAGRADLTVTALSEAERKDPDARRAALRGADVAILCLPDDAAREAVALIGDAPTRVIDASTAHRVAAGWAYGFAEMTAGHAGTIAAARFVSNPGCYPTGAIALLRPLREAGFLPADWPVSVNAISGYTGGGNAMVAEFEGGAGGHGFLYALGQAHKHLPEMAMHGLLGATPIFAPSVGPFPQGMIVSVPLHLDRLPRRAGLAEVHAALAAHYAGAGLVEVAPLAGGPARLDAEALAGSDAMRLHVFGVEGRAVLCAVLDNLGKGAAGAAVQNLNLMLGLPGAAGLKAAA